MVLVIGAQMHTVYAAQGTIRITLPDDMKEKVVHYSCEGSEEETVSFASEEQVILNELEPGTYKIRVEDTETYRFSESKITLPMWEEEENKMDFVPNEIYTCYGRVDTVNTSEGIFNYQVTLKDNTQLNLKVADSELGIGDV